MNAVGHDEEAALGVVPLIDRIRAPAKKKRKQKKKLFPWWMG